MNAIDIKGLTKTYGDFKLDALTMELPEGRILGFIGENGAGKTTTIRLLLGMAKPDEGTASVLGTDIAQDMSEVKQNIGVVMDEPGLPQCLTAQEVGEMMAGIYKDFDADYFAALLKRLALADDTEFGKLSRGNKMKLGIAIALAHKPKLLILDEPTSGLDPVVRDVVVKLLGEFAKKEGHSVLISSHIVSDLEKLCDDIAFIHKGRLMLYEEKDALVNRYCFWQGTAEAFADIDKSAVIAEKETEEGVSAIVSVDALPEESGLRPVTLEELFVFMVREEEL